MERRAWKEALHLLRSALYPRRSPRALPSALSTFPAKAPSSCSKMPNRLNLVRTGDFIAVMEVCMKTAVVIPARYASSRLPGKPLLKATGKYLIQHVYERACQSRAGTVLVATDDERILQAVHSFGGKAVMTRPDHQSGTDRIAEVAQSLDADIIVNLQGDEPTIDPLTLDMLPHMLKLDPAADVATVAAPITSMEQW